MPDNKILLRVRSGIEANLSAWEEIVQDGQWKHVYGELLSNGKLTRPPKGFDKDSPALEWIKWKGFYVSKALTDEEATQEDVVEQIVRDHMDQWFWIHRRWKLGPQFINADDPPPE